MMFPRALLSLVITMLAVGVLASSAQADCTNPAGTAGRVVYASNYNSMAYCNGTSWVSMAGGVSQTINTSGGTTAPGGSDTYVQYNSGGAFAGSSGFTWNNASSLLTATNISSTAFSASGAATVGTLTSAGLISGSGVYAGPYVQLTSDTTACASGQAGRITYSGGGISYCNGTAWTSLANGNAGVSAFASLTDVSVSAVGGNMLAANTLTGANGGATNATAFGLGALAAASNSGNQNTALGTLALNQNTSGYRNTATGANAMISNTTGYSNTANGALALAKNTTGYNNTANGVLALQGNTTGYNNTASGYGVLSNNTTGNANTGGGGIVLANNTTGSGNTGYGYATLYVNSVGSNNTAVGLSALTALNGTSGNTALGAYALYNAYGGTNNLSLGLSSGYNISTGSSNTLIGVLAGSGLTTGSNNIMIGANAQPVTNADSNTLNIGNALFGNLTTNALGIGSSTVPSSLTILTGEVQVGSSGATCTTAKAGAIRYNGTVLQYCNGSAWTTSSGVGVTYLASLTDVGLSGLASGQVLQYNGVSWTNTALSSALTGAIAPSFNVNNNGVDETVTSNGYTKITWSTKVFDTNNNFASNTYTPTVAGKYLISLSVGCKAVTNNCIGFIYKNGVALAQSQVSVGTSSDQTVNISQIINFNGTTDYVQAYVYSGNSTTLYGDPVRTNFSGAMIAPLVSGSVAGTGTTNYVARWTSSTVLGTGLLYDTGSFVGVSNTNPNATLDVNGSISGTTLNISGAATAGTLSTGGLTVSGNSSLNNVSATNLQLGAGGTCSAAADGGKMRYNGTALQYCNGTTWTTSSGVGVSLLASLTDVSLSNLGTGQILRYNGVSWTNVGVSQAMSTTTMVQNWPDAIICGYASTPAEQLVLIHGDIQASGGLHYYYFVGAPGADNMAFNNDGTYNSSAGIATTGAYACGASYPISTLYAIGRAYNYIGSSLTSAASPGNSLQYSNSGTLAGSGLLYTSSTNSFALGTPVTGASLTIVGLLASNQESTGGLAVSGVASITTISGTNVSATNLQLGAGGTCSAAADGGKMRYNGTALQYCNGTTWTTSSGVGVSYLASLTDVGISSPVVNNVLAYNGTSWTNLPVQQVMSTTTMVPNMPDAIYCTDGSYPRALYLGTIQSGVVTYYPPWEDTSGSYGIGFNVSTGAYSNKGSNVGTTECSGMSISQLYAAGKAFNFIGSNLNSAASPASSLQYSNNGTLAGSGLLYTSSTNSFALGTPVTGASLTIAGLLASNQESTGGLSVSGVASITTVSGTNVSATNLQLGAGGTCSASTDAGKMRYYTTSNTLQYCNGSAWTTSSGVGVSLLASLTDVSLSNLGTGQILRYNGVSWTNASVSQVISTTTMVQNFPDAIKCTTGAGTSFMLYLTLAPYTGNYYYVEGWNGNGAYMTYTPAGAIASDSLGATSDCSGKSLSQLYATGQAFNFIGTSNIGAAIGTNALQYSNNGTMAASGLYYISSTGDVGLGLTTPRASFDVSDSGGVSTIRAASGNGGATLMGLANSPDGAWLSAGTDYNGSNWVARGASATVISMSNGVINFASNLGLTSGSTFTPTLRMTLTTNGGLGIGTASNVAPSSITVVAGEVQTASSGAACSSSNGGAIRYTGGVLSYCNGASSWLTIAGTASASTVQKFSDLSDVSATGGNNMFANGAALSAGTANTVTDSTAFGYLALSASSNTGFYNTAFGRSALAKNTTGYYNTALGGFALPNATTAYMNTAVGLSALAATTTGNQNTAVGTQSMNTNTTGTQNTAIGLYAQYAATTASYNTAVGAGAMQNNTTGGFNVAIGTSAGLGASGEVVANSVLVGYQSGYALTTGINNTLVGYQTGLALTTGNNNTLLGLSAGSNLTTGSSNILIGNNAQATAAGSNNQLNIGGILYGNLSTGRIGVNTVNPSAMIEADSNAAGTPGIYAYNTVSGNQGYMGLNNTGISGIVSGTGSSAYGVYGMATSASGTGVFGYNSGNGAQGALGTYTGYGVYCASGSCGGVNAWTNTSDVRLKKNIVDLSYGLATVEKLHPVFFDWKHPLPGQIGRQVGLIAQEVEKVVPEVVSTAKDASQTKSIAYSNLVPVLIKSVQELKVENDALKSQNDALAKRLDRLEAQFSAKH